MTSSTMWFASWFASAPACPPGAPCLLTRPNPRDAGRPVAIETRGNANDGARTGQMAECESNGAASIVRPFGAASPGIFCLSRGPTSVQLCAAHDIPDCTIRDAGARIEVVDPQIKYDPTSREGDGSSR